ncbi:hypothetical protein LXA43DRAFT_1066445 [Ganoderma leucocontextum]|nr:hypothetical protein LXA43DRAFT_1066445 [Ganoderma leucocontextum]
MPLPQVPLSHRRGEGEREGEGERRGVRGGEGEGDNEARREGQAQVEGCEDEGEAGASLDPRDGVVRACPQVVHRPSRRQEDHCVSSERQGHGKGEGEGEVGVGGALGCAVDCIRHCLSVRIADFAAWGGVYNTCHRPAQTPERPDKTGWSIALKSQDTVDEKRVRFWTRWMSTECCTNPSASAVSARRLSTLPTASRDLSTPPSPSPVASPVVAKAALSDWQYRHQRLVAPQDPEHEPESQGPPPPARIKLSFKDFVLQKKKREEQKEQEQEKFVVGSESESPRLPMTSPVPEPNVPSIATATTTEVPSSDLSGLGIVNRETDGGVKMAEEKDVVAEEVAETVNRGHDVRTPDVVDELCLWRNQLSLTSPVVKEATSAPVSNGHGTHALSRRSPKTEFAWDDRGQRSRSPSPDFSRRRHSPTCHTPSEEFEDRHEYRGGDSIQTKLELLDGFVLNGLVAPVCSLSPIDPYCWQLRLRRLAQSY